jgi:uncharacterized DUF497 family protein
MRFEFDPNKSVSNKIKHGIDFEEAQALWLDLKRIEIDARIIGESRKLLITVIEDEVWSAIFTWRNESIRIISVRKSRKNEKEIYYNTTI